MSNKDLLKQAIAEAKTIREAAIANAKEALEETLTPHLKEMLAQKLQEMEEDDMNEDQERMNGSDQEDGTAGGDHGNIVKEAEEEAPEEGEEETEEGEEEEDQNIEDMTVEELKDLIRDIVHQEVEHEEEETPGEEAAEPEHGDDMTSMDDSEEIDINELLAELEGMDERAYSKEAGYVNPGVSDPYGEKEEADYGPNDGYKIPSKRTPANSKSGNRYEPAKGYKPGKEIFSNKAIDEDVLDESLMGSVVDMLGVSNDTAQMLIGAVGAMGVIGASAITSKLHDMALKGAFGPKAKAHAESLAKAGSMAKSVTQQQAFKPQNGEEMEEGLGSAIKGGIDKFDKWIGNTSNKMSAAGQKSKAVQSLEKGVSGAQDKFKKAGLSTNWNGGNHLEEENEELNEALATVNNLKTQLQEVNLLNAKLLYVNKVFKSNNLSEGQKVNVIAAFDKAETVKEVKLVFETVSKNVATKPAAIKEHRSFASKATGNAQTTAPKEIISEVSEQVARWQKLAGIIKS